MSEGPGVSVAQDVRLPTYYTPADLDREYKLAIARLIGNQFVTAVREEKRKFKERKRKKRKEAKASKKRNRKQNRSL